MTKSFGKEGQLNFTSGKGDRRECIYPWTRENKMADCQKAIWLFRSRNLLNWKRTFEAETTRNIKVHRAFLKRASCFFENHKPLSTFPSHTITLSRFWRQNHCETTLFWNIMFYTLILYSKNGLFTLNLKPLRRLSKRTNCPRVVQRRRGNWVASLKARGALGDERKGFWPAKKREWTLLRSKKAQVITSNFYETTQVSKSAFFKFLQKNNKRNAAQSDPAAS